MCNASVLIVAVARVVSHRAYIFVDHVAATWLMSDCLLRFKGEFADGDDPDMSIRTVL